jgi:uncharacterized protein involved in exopolysaccharide biosynthesis
MTTSAQNQSDAGRTEMQTPALAHHHGKTFADYLTVLKSRWRLVVVIFVVIFMMGVLISYSQPPVYRSTAKFLVKEQSIPEDIVETTVTGYRDEQIEEVTQRVMATANLKPIIEKYDLFSASSAESLSPAIKEFRKNTYYVPQTSDIMNPRTGRAIPTTVTFEISFEYGAPLIAKQVTKELAELYLKQNLASRAEQTQATIDFLEADIERSQTEVDRTGRSLTKFKEAHAGNLPSLQNFHLQLAERTERQIDALDQEIRNVRDRKIELEGQLRNLVPYAPAYDEDGNPIMGSGERLSELKRERLRLLSLYNAEHPDIIRIDKEIEALSGGAGSQSNIYDLQSQIGASRTELAAARQRYSEDHPDIRQRLRELAALEAQLAQLESQASRQSDADFANPLAKQIQELIDASASDLRDLSRRRAELVSKLEEIERKLVELPEIAREFDILSRNFKQAQNRYNEALDKLDEARMAERLESGGGGQRLILIGDPQMPDGPYQPIRAAIVVLAIVLGVGAGVIVATLVDTLDDTIKSSRDLLMVAGTPALAVIPYLENESERRTRVGKNFAVIGLLVISIITAIVISQFFG